jgi:hypothetical protein
MMETDPRAARVLADALARQAAALHVVFMRTFADVLSNKERSLRDVSRALKAQNQCRIALRLLLKLRAVEQWKKNSRNRTNRLLREQNHHHDQALGKAPLGARLWSTEAPPQTVGLSAPKPYGEGGLVPGLVRRSPAGEGGTTSPTSRTHACVGALEKVDGSANGRGQNPLRSQRAQARPQKPCLHRTEARRAAASPPLRRDDHPRQGAPPRPLGRRGVGRILSPTSPNAARRPVRRRVRRSPTCPREPGRRRKGEGGSAEREGGSRAFARSPPRCLEPSRCMRPKPWHRLGSRAILATKYAKYGGETCAH